MGYGEVGGLDDDTAFDVLMEIGVEQSFWITVVGRMIFMQLLKQENGQEYMVYRYAGRMKVEKTRHLK